MQIIQTLELLRYRQRGRFQRTCARYPGLQNTSMISAPTGWRRHWTFNENEIIYLENFLDKTLPAMPVF